MTQKNNQPQLMMGGIAASDALCGGSLDPVISSLATLREDEALVIRKVTVSLDSLVITHTEALDYSSVKIADMPDSNLLYLSVEADLECVKGEVTNGLEDTTDITLAVGTVAASNSTLSATMQDLIELETLTPTDASPAYQKHSADQSTIPMPYQRPDAATNAIYLNLAAATTEDDTLTCTGSITVRYIDLGNVIS